MLKLFMGVSIKMYIVLREVSIIKEKDCVRDNKECYFRKKEHAIGTVKM